MSEFNIKVQFGEKTYNFLCPEDQDIIETMSKIGYEKIKLDGRRLLKSIKGQMLDVNAIAKGWGVDEVFEYLKSQKLSNFMVEIGGELSLSGYNSENKKFIKTIRKII